MSERIRKIRCWLGLHVWRMDAYLMRHGHRQGQRCMYCGMWHKDSVIVPYPNEEGP